MGLRRPAGLAGSCRDPEQVWGMWRLRVLPLASTAWVGLSPFLRGHTPHEVVVRELWGPGVWA